MYIRINLILLLSFTLGWSFPFFGKEEKHLKNKDEKQTTQEETLQKAPENTPPAKEPVESVKETAAPTQEENQIKSQEPDIFQSAVIIKNESFHPWTKNQPWNQKNTSNGFGTGFIISGNRILTNAHVVLDANYISVKHYNDRTYYKATVKYIGTDCDLAILEVEDPSFVVSSPVIAISDKKTIPGSEIMILGYPEGSENLSVEKGVITGIEKLRYAFSGTDYRNAIRVKTAIRPGFSGGPAIENGKLAGIAFQINRAEKNTAYLVPPSVIQHFLSDIEDGTYDGFPETGVLYQTSENPSLREFMKIPDQLTGIIVNRVLPESSFYGALREGDFIYKIDTKEITNEGVLKEDPTTSLEDLLGARFVGDQITVMFYRDGKDFFINQRLKKAEILNLYRYDSSHYFTNAGLIFQPLSRTLLGKRDDPTDSSLSYHYHYFLTDNLYRYTDRDIVLTHVFPDPENISANKYQNNIVETINGYTPNNLDEFKKLWGKLSQETIVIHFRGMELPLVLYPDLREQISIRVRKRYGLKNN